MTKHFNDYAATLAGAIQATHAQNKTGVEKLYIINCGEGVSGETDDKVVTYAGFIVIAFFPILIIVLNVIYAFNSFAIIWILTQGGPAYSSEVLSTLSYRYAFYNYTIGPAAAVALVISFFGLIATVFYVRIQQREGA